VVSAGWSSPTAVARSSVVFRDALVAVGAGLAVAVAVAYTAVSPRAMLLVLVGAGAAAAILTSDARAAFGLGLSLPLVQDLSGGHLGIHIAASDVVLVLIGARLLIGAARSKRLEEVQALRPVGAPVLQYLVFVLLLLAVHFDAGSVAKTLQRMELIGLPLLAGAFVALRNHHARFLRGYVIATTALAVTWPILSHMGHAGQLQKNPVGQLIVNAILLLIAVPGLRRLLFCLPLLVTGLGFTASRGAILALGVGVIVLTLYSARSNPRMIFARALLLAVAGLAAYQLLPATTQSRLFSLSGSAATASGYPIAAREDYARQAERIIRAHPWTGVGVGNYFAEDPSFGASTDPHDVVLLEAAEGGYMFAASFIVLIAGSAGFLWRRRTERLAAAAAAVMLATAAHGLVDIYWVRVTPVAGWTMVGVACGLAYRTRAAPVPRRAPTKRGASGS